MLISSQREIVIERFVTALYRGRTWCAEALSVKREKKNKNAGNETTDLALSIANFAD